MSEGEHIFAPAFNRSVRVEARDEELSGDAGAVLLRDILERTGGLDRLVVRLHDPSDSRYVIHDLKSLISTAVLRIAQGWRPGRDIDRLRGDQAAERTLSSQPTLSRLRGPLQHLGRIAEAATITSVKAFERRKPSRKPFPEHLPREHRVEPAPTCCGACGSDNLSKLAETITESLESLPRSWKVIQTVREKFSCRCCEHITQPPAPFHPVPRAWAGPSLLVMILYEKFGNHRVSWNTPTEREVGRCGAA